MLVGKYKKKKKKIVGGKIQEEEKYKIRVPANIKKYSQLKEKRKK